MGDTKPTAGPGGAGNGSGGRARRRRRVDSQTVAGRFEVVPPPATGRVFSARGRVRLGDVDTAGRVRLDAVARYLQDVAGDDARDAGLAEPGRAWVLRRHAVHLGDPPRYLDDVLVATWCSGTGPRWAERRTDVLAGGDARVEAVALWAYVDLSSGAPVPLPARFEEVYGDAHGGRRVSARLRHGPPAPAAEARPWPLRAVDFDLLGHVNNAAYWAAVEECLDASTRAGLCWAELEFRGGIDAGDEVTLLTSPTGDGAALWLTVGGDVRASALVGCDDSAHKSVSR